MLISLISFGFELRSAHQCSLACPERTVYRVLQIIMNNLPQAESEVGTDVDRRDDLENWQLGDGRQSMRR